jgi:Pyridoxamine 5'-phosphate oxidase
MPDAAMSSGEPGDRHVGRLLAAARDAIAEVPICWVVTPTEDGLGANARAVRDCTGRAGGGGDAWTRWFLALPGSRKAAEIRRAGRATLAYQHGSGDAYVTLVGRAELVDDRSVVAAGLRLVDDPDGSAAARLVAVRVMVDRVEVHVRGVTAEPWGRGRTLLERDGEGAWRLLSG